MDKYRDYQAAVEEGNAPELEDGEQAPTQPVFDKNFFFFNWDEEHPEIDIPEEVQDDVDNDWMMTAEKKEDLLK